MIKISELTPLCFDDAIGNKWHDSEYLQRWYYNDDIMLQVLYTTDESIPAVRLDNLTKGTSSLIATGYASINTTTKIRYVMIHLSKYTTDGVCRVRVNGMASKPFLVCSDAAILDETTLIRVSGSSTMYKPFAAFSIGGVQQIFQMRLPIGIKANGYQPRLEDENYRTQTMDIVHLWQMPYEAYNMTIGNAEGVGWWVARWFNNAMCAPIIEIGDYQYRRSDDSIPTLSETYEGSERFIITQLVERVPTEDEGTLYSADYNDDYNNDFAI